MHERPRMKFRQAGSRLEIPDVINRIPHKERVEANLSKYTVWIGRHSTESRLKSGNDPESQRSQNHRSNGNDNRFESQMQRLCPLGC